VVGGIVLAGGRSTRMGADKASLDWHGSTLAHRVAALLRRTVAGPVLVVAAADQVLPGLPTGVEVVRDHEEGGGPPAALARGLAALAAREARTGVRGRRQLASCVAFATAVDAPLLHPAVIRRVLALLGEADCAMPVLDGHRQPLAAAYRASVLALADGAGRLPPLFRIADLRPSRLLTADDLLADPAVAGAPGALDALRGLNSPDAFTAALALPEPEVACDVGGRRVSVRAATAGRLLDRLGLPPDTPLALAGVGAVDDPRFPLVDGDRVRVSPRAA
jgi:molybdopterin-guanine dinucleotide biosynthesis protein A